MGVMVIFDVFFQRIDVFWLIGAGGQAPLILILASEWGEVDACWWVCADFLLTYKKQAFLYASNLFTFMFFER